MCPSPSLLWWRGGLQWWLWWGGLHINMWSWWDASVKSWFWCDFRMCCPLVGDYVFAVVFKIGPCRPVLPKLWSCDFLLQTSSSVHMGGSALRRTKCVMVCLTVRTAQMNSSVIGWWRAAITTVMTRPAAFLKPSYVTGKETVRTAVMKQTVVCCHACSYSGYKLLKLQVKKKAVILVRL